MPPSSSSAFVCFLVLLPLFAASEAQHSCSDAVSISKCPPFASPLPFPFSVSPGCGHPSFRIRCSASSAAAISVNNLSFAVVQYDPNSTSLTLSPVLNRTASESGNRDCPSAAAISYFRKPISFSGSPFRVSDSSCSRLSVLRPCDAPDLPNCTACSWECKLIKNPVHLVRDCGGFSMRRRESSQPECPTDVLGVLDRILRIGLEVEWDENQDPYFSSCRSCRISNGFCGYNSTDPAKPFLCFSSQGRIRIRRQGPNLVAIVTITFFFVCTLLALFIGVALFRSKRSSHQEDPTISFLRRHRLLPPVFTFDLLAASTNHFDAKRKIGDGGFGSVYLGQLEDGRVVAVKYLHKQSSGGAGAAEVGCSKKSFCNEILILSSINHPNLVKLHGYCCDPRGLLLVYDYVPNGTLADHLHGDEDRRSNKRDILPWSTRVDIAFSTAVAIEYLHFSVIPPIVHRDITSSNIFVEKDMSVKLGDFGLSRLLVQTAGSKNSGGIWTGPQGTPGYLDPDYYQSFMLNEKSDIYSFGVVLLELITGMKAVDTNREKREVALVDLVVPRIQMGVLHQVVDPLLGMDQEAMDGVGAVAELAFRCVASDKDDRPDARQVAAELKRIKCGTGTSRGSNSSICGSS